jgi:two-component sensor histidine kinase
VSHVLQAIAGSVQRTFGRSIDVRCEAAVADWEMPEAESIPIALTLNELLTNAIKHGQPDGLHCDARLVDEVLTIVIGNRGRLPEGFDLARYPGSVSGLGLARALLPRRTATLALEQQGDEVLARVTLRPPSVVKAPAQAAAGAQ